MIAFGWEATASIVGSLLVVGLIILLVLHEPRDSRTRIGVFLERRANDKKQEDQERRRDG